MEVRCERVVGADWIITRAETDDEEVRLRHEAGQLRAAAHPGVVELGPWTGERPVELRTRLAGRPLIDVGPLAAAEVSGLGAAVATVLADLHDVGVVHGALRPDHILVGPDGRPVLCGFGSSTTVEAGDPTLDVRDLAAILAERLDAGAPRRLTTFLARTAAGGGRREVSARALASRLGDLMPDRCLPSVDESGVGRAAGRAVGTPSGPDVEVGAGRIVGPAAGDDGATGGLGIVCTAGRPSAAGGVLRLHPLRLAGDAPSTRAAPEARVEVAGGAEPARPHRRPLGAPPAGGATPGEERPGTPGHGNRWLQNRSLQNRWLQNRWRVAAGAVAVVVVAAGIGLWIVGRPVASAAACPRTDAGCGPVPLVRGQLVTTAGRFVIGLPDPVVVLGRWGCSQVSLPAALDRRTGQVWAWPAWAPSSDGVRAVPVVTSPGASSLRVIPGRSGCDRLDVIGPGTSSAIVRPWARARA
jgi:hypothetical protein